MMESIEASYWLTEGKINTQVTYDLAHQNKIDEVFSSWMQAAEGYDSHNQKKILVFIKTVDNSEEIVHIIDTLNKNSFLVKEVT